MARQGNITGVMLAGGQGARMGGVDKGLVLLGENKPLAQWVLERFAPQVDALCINANRNLARYAALGAPFAATAFPDRVPGFAGPLAGIHAALSQAQTPFVASAPCDSPFLPRDLVCRLWQALNTHDADLAVARDKTRVHPVFCLYRRALLPGLEDFLKGRERRITAWHQQLRGVEVCFDEADAFCNLNTPEELERMQARFRQDDPCGNIE
jgi:molybdopterin-guanine dinucleotide biosynthesis protein A